MKGIEVKDYVKGRCGEKAKSGEPYFGSCCVSATGETASRMCCPEEDLANVPESSDVGLGCGNPVASAFQNLPIYAWRLFHV